MKDLEFTPTISAIEQAVEWLAIEAGRSSGRKRELYEDILLRIAETALKVFPEEES